MTKIVGISNGAALARTASGARYEKTGRAPRPLNAILLFAQQKIWLGRQDSNLGMAESKSAALPLGYAPMPPEHPSIGRVGPHRIAAAIAPGNESLWGPAGPVPERRDCAAKGPDSMIDLA